MGLTGRFEGLHRDAPSAALPLVGIRGSDMELLMACGLLLDKLRNGWLGIKRYQSLALCLGLYSSTSPLQTFDDGISL